MRLRDQVAKVARPAKLYATVLSTTTTNATVKLDSGAVLSNIGIIGGPITAGERVLIVYLDKIPYVNAPGKQQVASVQHSQRDTRRSEPTPLRDSMTLGGWSVSPSTGVISQQETLISREGFIELGDLHIDGDHATHKMWKGSDPNASPFFIDNHGNIKAANFITSGLVDGIDVSAHAGNPNAHHSQVHNVTSSDHVGSGDELDVIGFAGANTLGVLKPSSDPGQAAKLLRSTNLGGLTLEKLTVRDDLDVLSGDLTVGPNILFVDNSQGNVGIGGAPDPQFRLDVHGPLRAQYFVGPHALAIPDAKLILHFDAAGNQYSTFNVSTTGHLGQVPTNASGGISGRPGKFNKAISIAQAGNNLVTNPSFEASTTGWTATSGTASRSQDVAYSGVSSLKLMNTGGSNLAGFSVNTQVATNPAQGSVYQASLMFYAPPCIVGKTAKIMLWESGGVIAEASGFSEILITETGWNFLCTSGTIIRTGRTSLALYFQTVNVAVTPNEYIYLDAVICNSGTVLRPYFDGSYGPGHAWTGFEHVSESTRTNARLSYSIDQLPMPRGSLALWVFEPGLTSGSARYLIDTRDASNLNSLILYIHNLENKVTYRPVTGITLQDPDSLAPGWRHIAITWDYISDQYRLYVDGALKASSGGSNPQILF